MISFHFDVVFPRIVLSDSRWIATNDCESYADIKDLVLDFGEPVSSEVQFSEMKRNKSKTPRKG